MTSIKKPAKRKAGRPTTYTDDISDEICNRLAGGQSLRTIVLDPKMPARTTVYEWLRVNERFALNYNEARNESADADFEQIGDIAQDVLRGDVEPNVARVAIDTIKWIAGRKKSKYSDKMVISGDKENPVELILKEVSGRTLEPSNDD